MRPGWTLAANKETKPNSDEQQLIKAVIRDCHTTSIGEWLVNQKPKLRSKFNNFLAAVRDSPMPSEYSNQSGDIAERFARDITQHKYHPVLRSVIDSGNGQFSDLLHILSLHMQRTNVMASIPAKRDQTPQLLRAIAQEDHIYSRPAQPKHELPQMAPGMPMTRGRMQEEVPRIAPTRSCKPTQQRSSPFAVFPSGEKMESTSRGDYVGYTVSGRTHQSGVCNVMNAPTCL